MLAVFFNPPLLGYFAKSNFLFGWSKNVRCLRNRILLEADPGPLPTAKMKRKMNVIIECTQTFKGSSYSKHFLQCVCYWHNLHRWMFFIPCGTHYFSMEVYRYYKVFFNRHHCVKNVRIRSYSCSYFPAFGLNTDLNNSEYGHFYAVHAVASFRNRCFERSPSFTLFLSQQYNANTKVQKTFIYYN